MNNPPRLLAWTDFVLDLHDFLQDKDIDTPLYIVGGAVRDAYTRGAIKDIDIAVQGNAIRMARNFADWFEGDIFVMDRERDVARVFLATEEGDVVLDFARFRGESLYDDLADRDFTVNAMAADLLGDIVVLIDPLNGETDLNQKVLRRCSPHAIADDPIRVLRAVRQSVQLKLRIEPETLDDIRQFAPSIRESSPERIRDEFWKILALDKPSQALRVLQHLGILKYVVPNIDQLAGIEQALPHRHNVWNHTLLVIERLNTILTSISYKRTDNTAATFDMGTLVMQLDRFRAKLQAHISRTSGNGRRHAQTLILGALIHNLGKIEADGNYVQRGADLASELADDFKLTNDEQKRLVSVIRHYRDVLNRPAWETLDLHRFWYDLGENGIDACLFVLADYLGMVATELEQGEWLILVERVTILLDTYFNHHDTIVNPPLFLNGNDLMTLLNINGGRVIGTLLTRLREAQVTHQVETVDAAEAFIQSQYQELST